MRHVNLSRLVLAAIAVAAPLSLAEADDTKDLLEGRYTIVSGERYGAKLPDEEVKGTMVRIAENGIIVTDKDKKDVYATAYTIDTKSEKGPWKLTLTSKLAPSEGKVSHGLLKKEGDKLHLIYSLPGGEAPTGFTTKEKQLMFVLKKDGE